MSDQVEVSESVLFQPGLLSHLAASLSLTFVGVRLPRPPDFVAYTLHDFLLLPALFFDFLAPGSHLLLVRDVHRHFTLQNNIEFVAVLSKLHDSLTFIEIFVTQPRTDGLKLMVLDLVLTEEFDS